MAKKEKYFCDKCGKEISNSWFNHLDNIIAVCGYVLHKDLCKDCGNKLVDIVKEFFKEDK